MTSCYTLCPSCGFCLGEIHEFVVRCKEGFYAEKIKNDKDLKNFDKGKLELHPKAAPPITHILDALQLKLCCRSHVISAKEFGRDYQTEKKQ